MDIARYNTFTHLAHYYLIKESVQASSIHSTNNKIITVHKTIQLFLSTVVHTAYHSKR